MDLELNSEGGSGGPTSVCSDQRFDGCGAELVLDLLDGGVVGRAQPRSSFDRAAQRASPGQAKGSSRGALAPPLEPCSNPRHVRCGRAGRHRHSLLPRHCFRGVHWTASVGVRSAPRMYGTPPEHAAYRKGVAVLGSQFRATTAGEIGHPPSLPCSGDAALGASGRQQVARGCIVGIAGNTAVLGW